MTKLTKISAIALCTLFLTACDKLATKTAQTPAAQTEQKAEASNTGAQDYQTFIEWKLAQEKLINDAIANELQKLGDKAQDQKIAQETINKTLLAQIDVIKQNSAALQIKDAQVNALKEKSVEVLTLGAQMIVEADKVAQNPTPEAHKAFSELQARLDKVAQEGKTLETELTKKYTPAVSKPTQAQ